MEIVAPAKIHRLETIDAGEIRRVQLGLPDHIVVDGKSYPLVDSMRPGTAFMTKPWGSRTQKIKRRMYTRSNIAATEPGILETFINDTHGDRSDTSTWWQSDEAYRWFTQGKTLDVRVTIDLKAGVAYPYENASLVKSTNLRLEEDGIWENLPLCLIAFGTGITPFLSYIRYMVNWATNNPARGIHPPVTLIASARHEIQLILHQELMATADRFSDWLHYFPVLTRTWPTDWKQTTGRIIREECLEGDTSRIDVSPLLELVPDLSQRHLRVCGNTQACRHITVGLANHGCHPLSMRSESW